MYQRILDLTRLKKSFFLWGQRQTGKSSLLKESFGAHHYIDLLKSEEFFSLSQKPSLLRERLAALQRGTWVILDEVQKIPPLLDEVQVLIEDQGLRFGLCGSSARKLKRGQANLLGGRATRCELRGFSAMELRGDFRLPTALNRGYLPSFYLDEEFRTAHLAYVTDYLKEEILAEGLTRNLPVFSRFLEVAALADTEILNFSNIGRETSTSPKTAQAHYDVLVDTLVGSYLPAYVKKMKRRTVQSPKFYFHDVGIVNFLAHRKELAPGSSSFGKAFENWIMHELQCFLLYSQSSNRLSYWKLTTEAEVDFILGDMEVAIEAKASEHIHSSYLKGLRELKADFPKIRERIVVCLEKHPRITEDGIWILPYQEFVGRLWGHALKPTTEIRFTD